MSAARVRHWLRAPLLPAIRFLAKSRLFDRYRRGLLATWHTPERRGPLAKIAFGAVFTDWITNEYWPEPDPDRREALKELCMGGDSGAQWAHGYDELPIDPTQRIGELALFDAWPVYPALERLLTALDRPLHAVQIGSSSGREIAWVAGRFPDVQCIGTDVYDVVVAGAASRYARGNLSFVRRSAKEIASLVDTLDGNLVLFDSASLQYVQPEHLRSMFAELARRDSTYIVLVDPVGTADVDPRELRGSVPRANFSYTHDYAFYAEEAGLATATASLIEPYASGPQRTTAHYFWAGSPPRSVGEMQRVLGGLETGQARIAGRIASAE